MRFAFSTVGVPGAAISDVVRLAAEHGFHGVELCAHPEEPVHPGLTLLDRADVVEEFDAAGIDILGVAGCVGVAAPGDDREVLREMRALLELARDLGAPHVRVTPGPGDAPSEESRRAAVRRLASVGPYASDLGVRVLLATRDSHPTGTDVARVLHRVEHGSVGALWDVMHTWRGGEEPETSHLALAPYLGHVQVKDIASAEDTVPLPLGAGVLPLADVVETLSRAGWEGWLCWEYEKRCHPQVPGLAELLDGAKDCLLRLLAEAA